MIVEAKNITVSYQNSPVLSDVSFSVAKGDFVGIVGPNGAGKTTLVKAVLGLLPLDAGSMNLFCRRTGYLQQRGSLEDYRFPASVHEVVRSGLIDTKAFPVFYSKADREKTDAVLAELDLYGLKDRMIGRLSGGQLQRVMLARALVNNPELLILDEPTSALDISSRENFSRLISEVNTRRGVTVLLVTHDLGMMECFIRTVLYIDSSVKFFGGINEFKTQHAAHFDDKSRGHSC